MGYLKHSNNNNNGNNPIKKKQAKPQPSDPVKIVVTGPDVPGYMPTPSLQHDINHVAGLSGIEESLDWIARGLSRLTSDEHNIHISTGYGTAPVKVTFADNDEEDAMDRLVTAIERIADSLAKLAGISRPRLEAWHEQEEYQPRYRSSAADGGAPGPAEVKDAHL